MNRNDIIVAMAEATRFQIAAQKALDRLSDVESQSWVRKETGAVKRASMDLTRALADMRRVKRP